MVRRYPSYPAVNAAVSEVRRNTFRGNTFGQLDVYDRATSERYEMADRYDVAEELRQALEERRRAGLPVDSVGAH